MNRHVDEEFRDLKDLILKMGGCVEKGLLEVKLVYQKRDLSRLKAVHDQEARINELQMLVDQFCVGFLAKQAPVAKDLRLIIASIKLNCDLERMGDQVVNIAHAITGLAKDSAGWEGIPELEKMFEDVVSMVRMALDAFAQSDTELCQTLLEFDDGVDKLKNDIVSMMTERMRSGDVSIEKGLQFIMMAKNLERLADHTTNIAEEVIYFATGDDIRHGHSLVTGS